MPVTSRKHPGAVETGHLVAGPPPFNYVPLGGRHGRQGGHVHVKYTSLSPLPRLKLYPLAARVMFLLIILVVGRSFVFFFFFFVFPVGFVAVPRV